METLALPAAPLKKKTVLKSGDFKSPGLSMFTEREFFKKMETPHTRTSMKYNVFLLYHLILSNSYQKSIRFEPDPVRQLN